MATTITSDTRILIDTNFKVQAGPGAGKTYWLVNHIKNVMVHSKRLGKCGKIACVTYTNVGVETIAQRIGIGANSVEICTIHSFFYSHIVKPYLQFIADSEGFNLDLLKGEDDRYDFSYGTLQKIKDETNQKYAQEQCLKVAIRCTRWRIDDRGKLSCNTNFPMNAGVGKTKLSNQTYLAYKKIAWSKGLMHYDDVIYFAYELVTKFPFIQEIIARKFPYIFIDEFQDSNPIQVEIIKKVAEHGTIIGVIGDPAQSIYKFLGADVKQFAAFHLKGMKEYVIEGNRRSSIEIVNFLNSIRIGLHQIPLRTVQGVTPSLLIGNHIDNYQRVCSLVQGEVCALSFDNLTANSLKKRMKPNTIDSRLIDNVDDSNEERKNIILTFLKALEHAKMGHFKKAFDLMAKVNIEGHKAVGNMQVMLSDYDTINKMSMLDFYGYLNDKFKLSMSALRRDSRPYKFYVDHKYIELALCIKNEDDDGMQRTIHKSKGDEFDNVMVCLGKEADLDFILNSDLENIENHRVYYVAASRAKERLFFSVPTLNAKKKSIILAKGCITLL